VKKERKIREWTKTLLIFSVRERKDLHPNSMGSTHTEREGMLVVKRGVHTLEFKEKTTVNSD